MKHSLAVQAICVMVADMVSKQNRVAQRPYFIVAVIIILVAVVLAAGSILGDHRFLSDLSGNGEAVLSVDDAIGATVEPLDRSTAATLGIPPESAGLVITSLGQNGPAQQAGIKPGDVIVRIGGKSVVSAREAATAFRQAAGAMVLTINRSGHYDDIRLTVRAPERRGPAEEGAVR